MIPFDKIVNGKGYGLKIDIEGGEGSLAEFPSIINNAAWIVGELHYSADTEQNSLIDTFFGVVQLILLCKQQYQLQVNGKFIFQKLPEKL